MFYGKKQVLGTLISGNSILYADIALAPVGNTYMGSATFIPNLAVNKGVLVIGKNGILGQIESISSSSYGTQYSIKSLVNLKGEDALKTYTYYDIVAAVDSWVEDNTISPFKHKAEVIAEPFRDDAVVIELINDNALLFAKYGFALASCGGGIATFYAVKKPEEEITFKVGVEQ